VFLGKGGIHAREWISPATVSFILNQLVTLYGSVCVLCLNSSPAFVFVQDTEVTHLVDAIEWTIVPIFNAVSTCCGLVNW
jgi:hypothetical protein